jgi:hypothetical protein
LATFPNNTNLNGAWSYGYRAAPASPTLTLMADRRVNGWWGPFVSDTFNFPLLRTEGTTLLRGHPPVGLGNPSYSVIRWTAPIAGTFELSTTIAHVPPGPGDGITAYFYKNEDQLWTQALNGSSGSYSNPSLTLTAGDHIDFVVDRGANDNNDQFNFNAVISVPEPAPAALLMSGAAAAGVWLASRRRIARPM